MLPQSPRARMGILLVTAIGFFVFYLMYRSVHKIPWGLEPSIEETPSPASMPSSECHTLHLPSCRSLTIMSYNIGEGAADSRTELAAFIRFHAPDIVALQELNHWSEEQLQQVASDGWGHAHTSFLRTNTGYHLGLTSAVPFEVIRRTTAGFHHGMIHVRFFHNASVAASSFDMRDQEQDDDDTDDLSSLSPDLAEQGLHVVVTHLSPNDAQKRLKETHHIDRLSLEHCELILLGDLNALSRYDEDVYTEAMLLGKLRQDPRLCRKFLDAELQGMPALDRMLCEHADISFATMDNLLRNGSLVDLGYEARLRNGRTFEHTVPTAANEDPLHAAEMRLDYFLATPALARPEVFRDVWVIHNEDTNTISDHFPIMARWLICPAEAEGSDEEAN